MFQLWLENRNEESQLTTNVSVPVPAPTVVTKSKVSLADHLDLRNLPLATTPAGRNFAMKCLHPADGEIKVARAPGGVFPSLGISYDSVETIQFPAGATRALLLQHPNLMVPASLVFLDATNTYVDHYIWANTAVGGAGLTHGQFMNAVLTPFANVSGIFNSVDSYRILAQSVTCDVIAPAVSDQGTIVCAQVFDKPRTVQPSYIHRDDKAKFECLWADCLIYEHTHDLSSLLMGTSAYTAKARDGFYQPLKVDKFKWVSVRDICWYAKQNDSTFGLFLDNSPQTNWSDFPIFTHNSVIGTGACGLVRPSSNVVGMCYIEGTSGYPDVSLRLRVRQTAELIPLTGSMYSPLTEAPYPPDDLAFRMVREIQGRMKDGYPASYNDLGKLKTIINTIGKDVVKYADPALDILSMIPGVGTVASAAKTGLQVAKGVNRVIQAIPTSSKKSASSKPTLFKSAVAAASSALSKKKKKKGKTK